MKTLPFDLEAALAGAPVVTRDGREVSRLIKRDVNAYTTPYVLEAYVPSGMGTPDRMTFTENGSWHDNAREEDADLFLVDITPDVVRIPDAAPVPPIKYDRLQHEDLQWALRRLPRKVLELAKEQGSALMIGGGYLRAIVAGEPISDIDIFAPSEYEARCFAEQLSNYEDDRLHTTDNAITVKGFGLPVQFIHRWTFDTPEEMLASFDFTVACAAFWWDQTLGGWNSLCDPRFYADVAAKRLIYRAPTRDEEPGGSMLRVLKFYQKGYRIPLDSLGAIIARLVFGQLEIDDTEKDTADRISDLLYEVDPAVDPTHIAHLPRTTEDLEAGA
jgi:hypothetical protein